MSHLGAFNYKKENAAETTHSQRDTLSVDQLWIWHLSFCRLSFSAKGSQASYHLHASASLLFRLARHISSSCPFHAQESSSVEIGQHPPPPVLELCLVFPVVPCSLFLLISSHLVLRNLFLAPCKRH